MKKKLIVLTIFGLITSGFFFFQKYRGTPIFKTSYSHFVESVRNKTAESVIFSERFIDYSVGSKKYNNYDSRQKSNEKYNDYVTRARQEIF